MVTEKINLENIGNVNGPGKAEPIVGIGSRITKIDHADNVNIINTLPSDKAVEEKSSPSKDGDLPANPYRGLSTFKEEDKAVFFGRDAEIDTLLKLVHNQPVTAILGASGSGKSSLVYAGLIPSLCDEGNWIIIPFRPGDNESPTRSSKDKNPFHGVLEEIFWQQCPALQCRDAWDKIKNLTSQLTLNECSLSDIVNEIFPPVSQ